MSNLVNVLEIVMLIFLVLARCAATVAIVWLLCSKLTYDTGTFWLILLTVVVGLGFGIKYDNPNMQAKQQQASHQIIDQAPD